MGTTAQAPYAHDREPDTSLVATTACIVSFILLDVIDGIPIFHLYLIIISTMTTHTTTITSLLNSLHTHLQSQTQLLPTLHTQLGLPPTALADDLSVLQKQLAECVESHIEHRRKQVDEWMGRCDVVERECLRYSKALGGHVKATGNSVGEIRKEQVLPKRYEMVSEYQEKLRQVRLSCTMRILSCPISSCATLAVVSYQTRAIEHSHKPDQYSFSDVGDRILSLRYPRANICLWGKRNVC